MPIVTLTAGHTAKRLSVPAGTAADDLLSRECPGFSLPCFGNRTCGKCRIRAAGELSAPSGEELRLLTQAELAAGWRLACCTKIEGDAALTLPEEGASRIITWYRPKELLSETGGLGFAADIGTTTVVLQLIDRSCGRILAERSCLNAQRIYGADVISRIEAAKKEGPAVLSACIRDQLEEMAGYCLAEAGGPHVAEAVVTGNTTMLHLFEGIDPAPLASFPFRVPSYFGAYSARTLAGAPVYLPRCMSAYVGADITCAVLASGMRSEDPALLTDIGTNGEMALWRNGSLLTCAAAAGPAFEGAGLSSGMPAAEGAIRKVASAGRQTAWETIGGGRAKGICGSGILDALALMKKRGDMDGSGYLENGDSWEIGASGIFVTQKDIRQIQLAKGAVCGGLMTLLDAAGTGAEEIRTFYIAGGFGSSLDPASAAEIGLFPEALEEKAVFIGNAALGGAVMLLLSPSLRTESEALALQARELPLSGTRDFTDRFIGCMAFERF